jgi:hypothetical protein
VPTKTVDMTPPTKTVTPPPPPPTKTVTPPPPPPPTKVEPPKVEAKTVTPPPKIEPTKTATPPKPPAKTESPKTAAKVTTAPKREKKETPPPPVKTEVATEAKEEPPEEDAPSGPLDPKAEQKAEALYKDKKFSDAAKVLTQAASKASGDKAKQLRRKSQLYSSLGKEYFSGMAAGSSSEAFEALRRAQNYDRELGNAFDADISSKLSQVAPKAATTYMAKKNYSGARDALIVAEKFGSTEGVKLVREKLESIASGIYAEASKELEKDPASASAKDKLRQIKSMVAPNSPWYQKADKLLKGSS